MKQIVVEKESFMYRWFAWSLKIVETFNPSDTNPNSKYLRGTNLCHMMRVLLFLAPLALLTELAIVSFAVYAFVWLPLILLGVYATITDTLIKLSIVGVIWLWAYFANRPEVDQHNTVCTQKQVTFGSLLLASIAAQKAKICPLIKFEGDQQ